MADSMLVVIIIAIVVIIVLAFRNSNRPKLKSTKREKLEKLAEDDIDSMEDSIDEKLFTPVSLDSYNFDPENIKESKRSNSKANMIPTYERNTKFNISSHEYQHRFEVKNYSKSESLPKNFSAIKQWENAITGSVDQERCGSCWAMSTVLSLTDRIKIKSNGRYLQNGDYLSPFSLAACMKCGKDGACPRVCEGNYLDDVLEYLVQNGAIAQSDIDKYSNNKYEYICFDHEKYGIAPWKGIRKYRVNIFPPSMLTDPEHLKLNEESIMREIYEHGTVNCIIKVYVPNDKRNFYIHKEGVYGSGWSSEPKETDGYHAINIIGWGEDEIIKEKGHKEIVKYWIIRNSWGSEWASQGFSRILKGVNFGLIESDVWAIDPDLNHH